MSFDTATLFPRHLQHEGEKIVYSLPSECPTLNWCRNYFYPGTEIPIPDGNDCCFQHWIGLPTREDIELKEVVRHPLYDYQEEILDCIELDEKRMYAIMKAPKLGATEFWLRFAMHQSLIDPAWEGGQVPIVNATRQSESNLLIQRIKELMENPYHPIKYDDNYNTKSTFTVHKTTFYAFPSGNIDAIRSKTNARMVLIDESAFFRYMMDDSEVKAAAEHYFGSINYYLVFISTAGDLAKGFFYDIIKYKDKNYNIFEWTNPDKYGLPRHPQSNTHMYSQKHIDSQRHKATFQRNYLGVWGAGSDTIFNHKDITKITKEYRIRSPRLTQSALGVDPAYGRGVSKAQARFGIVGVYEHGGLLYVDLMEEYREISDQEGQLNIHKAMKRGYKTLCIDKSSPGLIKDMRKSYHVKPMSFVEKPYGNTLEPVAGFDEPQYDEKLKMIDQLTRVIAAHKIRIHPKFVILLDQLRTIQRDERGKPNKKITRWDLGDALMMAVAYLVRHGFKI